MQQPVAATAAVVVGDQQAPLEYREFVGEEVQVRPGIEELGVKVGEPSNLRTPAGATLKIYRNVSSQPSTAGDAAERKADMFEAADIREWRGQDVIGPDGHKIGELEAVYVDTSTDMPAFGTVKVGLPTRHRLAFVPLAQAVVGPGYLKVAHDRRLVRDSPSISTDGELPAADEEAIFKHYGLPYQAGTSGERQLARR